MAAGSEMPDVFKDGAAAFFKKNILALSRDSCPAGAARLLKVVDGAREREGLSRVQTRGNTNRE
jgi:hypothetical protein